MNHKALESVLKYFEVKDNRLLISGKTCEDIANEIGTPFYAYDLNVAAKKLEMLRSALPDEVYIHYAIKANPHPDILRFFKDHGTGFDVASAGELQKLLDVGADPAHIGFAGPGKREFEIRLACQVEIGSLNAESIGELELANRIGGEEGKKIRVALRVNPSYELVGSGMKMGGGPKQFGIDQEMIPDVLRRFGYWEHLEFVGFHIFAGSQNLRADSIISAFNGALDAVIGFLPICPARPQMVNLGGGFGIPYYTADEKLPIESVGEGLHRAIEQRKRDIEDIKLVVETGRYLIGESGVYVCRVLYQKESRGEIFLIIDGGMHQNLAASGNFGQVLKRNYPISLADRIGEEIEETVNIVGPLCTPLDRLGTKVRLPHAEPGNLVVFFISGAYGYTASPMSFLGHPYLREIVL